MRIYVANLPESATDADVQALFSQYGDPVSTQMDAVRANGVAYVEMPDEFAELAIDQLNGRVFRTSALVVHPATLMGGAGGWIKGQLAH